LNAEKEAELKKLEDLGEDSEEAKKIRFQMEIE